VRVLVTGGSGLVGRAVIEDLQAHGHEAFNVDRKRPDHWLCPFREADMSNIGHLYDVFAQIRPEAVCHLAADPRPKGGPRSEVFQSNVMGAMNVFQVCGDLEIRRVAFASSEQALGYSGTDRVPARLPIREGDILPALHAYALSKQVGEQIAEAMTLTYPGMSIVSLRINYVAVASEYARFGTERGSVYRPYNFWGYVDSRDAARAFRLAIERDVPGHIVLNIAAKDHSLAVPTREAMAEVGFECQYDDGFPEFGGPMDCSLAKEILGWEAEHSWRDSSDSTLP